MSDTPISREAIQALIAKEVAEAERAARIDELQYLEIVNHGPATRNATLRTKYLLSVPDRIAHLQSHTVRNESEDK